MLQLQYSILPIDETSQQKSGPRIIYDTLEGALQVGVSLVYLLHEVQVRVFVVVAKYCATAVWEDERQAIFDGMRGSGLLSPGKLAEYFSAWWWVISNFCLFSSLQRSAGGTSDYTPGLLSWSGTWTRRRKLEDSLHGSEVCGGQGSGALTKPSLL